MYWSNLKSVAFPVSEIIAIGVLGRGYEVPRVWRRGSGIFHFPFERALVTS